MLDTIYNNSPIKRNNDNFSFCDRLIEFVGNKEFREGYDYSAEGIENNKSYIWNAISTIGQDVGEVIYENVLNFIDRTSNVDVCKTKSLRSMINMIGSNYSILNDINTFPSEIQDIIDVVSINKKYLDNKKIMDIQSIIDIYNIHKNPSEESISVIYSDVSGYTYPKYPSGYYNDLSTLYIPKYMENKDIDSYISGIIYNLITDIINLPYNDGSKTPIWKTKDNYNNFAKINTEIVLNTEKNKFKVNHGIDINFNEQNIVDNIDNGTDSIDNYSGYELELVKNEIEERSKPLYDKETVLKTRYSYYRTRKVKEYFDFVELQFNSMNELNGVEVDKYNVNYDYIHFNSSYQSKTLIDRDTKTIRIKMIQDVTNRIVQIISYIRKLRDKIKIHVQQNYMKGTFNLLQYLINEYLIEFSKIEKMDEPTLSSIRDKLRNHDVSEVQIIEYDDTTEYFNLKTDSTPYAINKRYTNTKFWDEGDEEQNSDSGFAFKDYEIEDFYRQQLNIGNTISSIDTFLSTLFENGATKSFIYDQISGDYILNIYGLSSISAINSEIFMSYNGNRFGYNPYLNHKNKTHSSYQVHPYLKKFIVHTDIKYPIKNAFYNELNIDIEDALVRQKLSTYIGEFGQSINVALNNLFDYSGYKTKYEMSTHESNLNANSKKNPIVDYTGSFYPEAVYDLMLSTDKFIDDVRTMNTGTKEQTTYYEKYYAHLHLNSKQYEFIANQLSVYVEQIRQICENKSSQKDVYDIYKYCNDAYDNSYILYKYYGIENPNRHEMQNTRGELWIRFKDHPIAFPAFYGKYPQVQTETDFNENIRYLAEQENLLHNMITDKNRMGYIYDFDLNYNHRGILMVVDPINDRKDGDSAEHHNPIISSDYYREYQYGDVIVCRISQIYNNVKKMDELFFYPSSNDQGLYGIENEIRKGVTTFDSKDDYCDINITGDSLIGIFKGVETIGPVYVQKKMHKNLYTGISNLIDIDDINIKIFNWKQDHPIVINTGKNISLGEYDENILKYKSFMGDIKYSYYDDTITLAIQTQNNSSNSLMQNYNGKHQSIIGLSSTGGYCQYNDNTIEKDEEYNSFDSLENYITIADFNIGNYISLKNAEVYNLNADASYIPAYAGEKGYSDYSKGTYRDHKYKSIELLGVERDIDSEIINTNPNVDVTLDLNELSTKSSYGRVWEFFKNEDKSLIQLFYNQFLDSSRNTRGNLTWIIDMDDFGYSQRDISNIYVIMYNTKSCGKNPYYTGNLTELCSTKQISLKNDLKTYIPQEIVQEEIGFSDDGIIKIVGTNSHFTNIINKYETNSIDNVQDITMQLYPQTDGILSSMSNKLAITFHCTNKNIDYLIPDKTICLNFCNEKDLKIFKYYHFMDANGFIKTEQDVEYIRNLELSDFNDIQEISCLSGCNTMGFKYSEEDFFNLSSPFYYYPVLNKNIPYRTVNFYKDTFERNMMSSVFSQTNVFRIKDIYDEIFDNIGTVEIPLEYNDTESYIAFEDYAYSEISDRTPQEMYNVSDPHSLSSIIFFGQVSCEIPYDIDNEILNYTTEKACQILESRYGLSAQTVETIEKDKSTQCYEYTVQLSNIDNISALLDIYVNYKVEDDESITLYFNYMNFLNTPYIQFSNNKTKINTIEGTYLKLRKDETGDLDIVIQLKMYDQSGRTLKGVRNVTLVTYNITNISDDKPKFLINKIYQIVKNQIKWIDNYGNVQVIPKTQKIRINDSYGPSDKIDFTLVVNTVYTKNIKSGSYYLTFPRDITYLDESGIVDKIYVDNIYKKNFNFRTNKTFSELSTNLLNTYTFSVVDSEFINTEEQEMEVEEGTGYMTLMSPLYLIKETNIKDDFITTDDKIIENRNKILL